MCDLQPTRNNRAGPLTDFVMIDVLSIALELSQARHKQQPPARRRLPRLNPTARRPEVLLILIGL